MASFNEGDYSIFYDKIDQRFVFEGSIRELHCSSLDKIKDFILDNLLKINGLVKFDIRKLRYSNFRFVVYVMDVIGLISNRGVKVKIVGSSILDWQQRVLEPLISFFEGVEYEDYDKNFYGGQAAVENVSMIDILRNQTRVLWDIEKEILVKHGLKRGYKVADVCCGCGDVSILVAKELGASAVVGYDHAINSIEYARSSLVNYNVSNVDFYQADATVLMVEDNTYDFTICRLSLQIFSDPNLILKELYRITRPGGVVYVTCEDYDFIAAYPNSENVKKGYAKCGEIASNLGMDMYSGRKLFGWMSGIRLKDIKLDYLIPDSVICQKEAFSMIIDGWRYFYTDNVSYASLSQSDIDIIQAGFDDQLRSLRHTGGYTNWSVTACSGVKG